VPTGLTFEPPRLDSPQQSEACRLKRVLFALNLDPAGKFGSIEEQVLTLARSFREQGGLFLPVFVRPLDSESANRYAQEGLEVEALALARFRLATLHSLLALVQRHRIDVVHWNFYHPYANGYVWALTLLKPGVEHYFTDHISRPMNGSRPDGPGRLKSRLKRNLASRYRKILCISDFVLEQVRPVVGPQAARVHYFVNTDRFRPDPGVRRDVRRQLGLGEEFVAITVAYLIKEKGVAVALNALARLSEDAVLWVIGGGPEQGNLEALARGLGVERRVRFLGPRRNVEPLMQAADCLLCPSLWAEAVGLVNLEALACGLPVIASRIGGIPELISDERTGFLVEPGDSRELADRVHRLMSNAPLRRRMEHEARSEAVRRFSTQCQLESSLRIYQD
jgi:glycosyltransferase involved in cell wall biosynthesis